MSLATELHRAKRRQQWVALGLGGSVVAVLAVYFVFLFFAKGYGFKVMPLAIQSEYSVSVKEGRGFVFGQKVYRLGGLLTVHVQAPKYLSETLLIDDQTPSVLSVELTPQPAQVTIHTDSDIAELEWSLNDELMVLSEVFTAELAPGEYTVTVSHPYIVAQTVNLVLEKAHEFNQTLHLARVQGSVQIASEPQGAEVLLNGQSIGTTPLEMARSGGRYDLELNLPGYEVLNNTLEVSHNELQVSRNYRMVPKSAQLSFILQPQDGVLTVNGRTVTQGVSVAVPTNTLTQISYRKPGFYPYVLERQFAPDEEATLPITLQAENGVVNIQPNVSAEVWINGVKQGVSPLQLTLPAIAQTIELRKPFYRTIRQVITPSASHPKTLSPTMLTEFAARRNAGQPTQAQQLGIEFIGVKPEAYKRGAEVNDSQRRANEFALNVDFTQPILVAKHEVTTAQYKAMFGQSGDNTPQTNVSWQDAARYCNWLSAQDALPPFYIEQNGQIVGYDPQSSGYRLLTESEWEWLAKAANRAKPTQYVWGDRDSLPKNIGNLADAALVGQQPFAFRDYTDSHPGLAPVGSYRADRIGLYDLVGNAKEWVHDRYSIASPQMSQVVDYWGAQRGSQYVVRGSSYQTGRLKELRNSYRAPGEPAADVGFRIARFYYQGL